MITVSVIMTTYGHEAYIAQAINGILMQQCSFKVELLVADDHSPDNTQEVVHKLLKNHPKKDWVTYIRHRENKGMMPNGIWAVQQGQGKYIALCEGDDYWTDPLKLQKQVDFLEANKEYGLVFTDLDFYYQKTGVYKKDIFKGKIMPLYFTFEEHLVNAGYLAPCTWVCRKELLPKFKESYVDGTFPWLLHILAHSKIKFLSDNTAVYRILKESASKSTSMVKKFAFSKGVFNIQKEFLRKYDLKPQIQSKIYRKAYLSIIPIAIALGEDSFVREARLFWNSSRHSFKEHGYYYFGGFVLTRYIFKLFYKWKSMSK